MIEPPPIEERADPITPRRLREFAGLCVLVFGGLFALSLYRHGGHPTPAGWLAGALAAGVGLPGLARPGFIRPFYLGATAATRPIGHLIGLALLALIYYGLITPLALAFRLLGRDPLGLRRREVATYWVPRSTPTDVRLYLRQFQQPTPAPPGPVEPPPPTCRESPEPETTPTPGPHHESA